MVFNQANNAEIDKQANLIVELYEGDKGKHYPLMNLEIPKYGTYPGYTYTSTTFTDEYEKYRVSELIKVNSES
jgi:hypothetical protein